LFQEKGQPRARHLGVEVQVHGALQSESAAPPNHSQTSTQNHPKHPVNLTSPPFCRGLWSLTPSRPPSRQVDESDLAALPRPYDEKCSRPRPANSCQADALRRSAVRGCIAGTV